MVPRKDSRMGTREALESVRAVVGQHRVPRPPPVPLGVGSAPATTSIRAWVATDTGVAAGAADGDWVAAPSAHAPIGRAGSAAGGAEPEYFLAEEGGIEAEE